MVWHPVIALVLALRLTLGLAMLPQLQPAMLTVSVRDLSDRGVSGVTVLVRDTSGAQEYGRAVTDVEGVAQFASVPTPDVRVAVEGSLADGTPLLLRGDDELGIRYTIIAEQATMYLRAEVDGTVLPDPALSVALEHAGGDVVELPPEAPVAVGPAPTLGLVAPTAAAVPSAMPVAVHHPATPAAPSVSWWQVALVVGVVVVLGGGAATLLLMRERL